MILITGVTRVKPGGRHSSLDGRCVKTFRDWSYRTRDVKNYLCCAMPLSVSVSVSKCLLVCVSVGTIHCNIIDQKFAVSQCEYVLLAPASTSQSLHTSMSLIITAVAAAIIMLCHSAVQPYSWYQPGTSRHYLQIYTRGSVLGKATKRDPEISPTPPLIFTGGQKC